MRNILFRAKRLKDKIWVEGSLLVIDADSGYYFITQPYKSASTLPVKDLIYNHTHLVDPETVCQFTGLTDKNGVMIYENDLLSINQSAEPVIVKFEDFQWKCKNRNFGKYYFHRLENIRSKYEVIGNIFDNPELLKGGAE